MRCVDTHRTATHHSHTFVCVINTTPYCKLRWNAARALAGFLQRNPVLYVGLTVLELGAGGGLPGLVAAKCGARKVVLTDYPDEALLDNLAYNVAQNVVQQKQSGSACADAAAACCVLGYVWGNPVDPLFDALLPDTSTQVAGTGFDLIILSDLIFNHSQVRYHHHHRHRHLPHPFLISRNE